LGYNKKSKKRYKNSNFAKKVTSMRHTKIVATIGPASESEEKIEELILAGVNVFRFNMKHGNVEWHSEKVVRVENVCKKLGKRVAALIDLQGPEVRVDGLPESPYLLKTGDNFWFTSPNSDRKGVVLDHPQVFPSLKVGNTMYADDGFLEFKITEVAQDGVQVEVVEGGELKNRKTVNFPGISLDFPCLVEKDIELLSLAARHTIDYVALSFVRNADDIKVLREQMDRMHIDCAIIAKIEHPDAVKNFEEILAASDGVMVARGDLGIEYPIEEVPALQKMIVNRCIEEGKPVIVATQMLESMHTNPRPTRAEVSDVANAVYDRADATMLSGESAAGKYPTRAVKMMAAVHEKTEPSADELIGCPVDIEPGCQTDALVAAAYELALTYSNNDNDIKAFVVLTETGRTAQRLSRLRPNLPVYALSSKIETLDRLELVWGVEPVHYSYAKDEETNPRAVLKYLEEKQLLHVGEKVIVIYGERWGKPGETSVVRIQEV
jgi:pyruvate kinase